MVVTFGVHGAQFEASKMCIEPVCRPKCLVPFLTDKRLVTLGCHKVIFLRMYKKHSCRGCTDRCWSNTWTLTASIVMPGVTNVSEVHPCRKEESNVISRA